MPTLDKPTMLSITRLLFLAAAGWGTAVAVAAETGWLRSIYPPLYGPLVVLGILAPVAVYSLSPTIRRYFLQVGPYPLTVLHVWRIPAALLFLWFGLRGELPPLFALLAGVGDFLAGLLAVPLLIRPSRPHAYRSIHSFGFADFVIAVGTGLVFTLLDDPRMATLRELPMALIPLFGVGISGASHLVAFDVMRRQKRYASKPGFAQAAENA